MTSAVMVCAVLSSAVVSRCILGTRAPRAVRCAKALSWLLTFHSATEAITATITTAITTSTSRPQQPPSRHLLPLHTGHGLGGDAPPSTSDADRIPTPRRTSSPSGQTRSPMI